MKDILPDWVKPDLWLDDNHCLEYTTRMGVSGPCGALFVHRDKRNPSEVCIGGFQWNGGGNGPDWTLVSMQPLHVEPSIHCITCGEHGWIREGKWVQV